MITRAEEIAKADAEVAKAERLVISEVMACNPGEVPVIYARHLLCEARKARAALDEPPKPRLRTPEESVGIFSEGYPIAEILKHGRREIAELVRAEMNEWPYTAWGGGRYVLIENIHDARDRIIAALEGK